MFIFVSHEPIWTLLHKFKAEHYFLRDNFVHLIQYASYFINVDYIMHQLWIFSEWRVQLYNRIEFGVPRIWHIANLLNVKKNYYIPAFDVVSCEIDMSSNFLSTNSKVDSPLESSCIIIIHYKFCFIPKGSNEILLHICAINAFPACSRPAEYNEHDDKFIMRQYFHTVQI